MPNVPIHSQCVGESSRGGHIEPTDVQPRSMGRSPDKPNPVHPIDRSKIQLGDLVIVFVSRDRPPLPITVLRGGELTNTYGSFRHDDMVGKPFGARMMSRNRRGFIHLLRPTPELWTLALPHRTQILYTPDMSFIAAHLGLSPGARVIEAGTGSGSFSHHLVRCVARRHAQSGGTGWQGDPDARIGAGRRRQDTTLADAVTPLDTDRIPSDAAEATAAKPASASARRSEEDMLHTLAQPPDPTVGPREGRIWTFEFHAGRALKAFREFDQHGLLATISPRHRNVLKDGFGLEGVADAVFLDLPAPWDALHHAAQAMRYDVATRICCFSPCIEQVLKTVSAMRQGGRVEGEADGSQAEQEAGPRCARWTDIETYECLNRTHLSLWSGPGTAHHAPSIEDAIDRIKAVERKKVRRREIQMERSRQERDAKGKSAAESVQRDTDAKDVKADLVDQEAGRAATDNDPNPASAGPVSPETEPAEESDLSVSLMTILDQQGKPWQRASILSRPFNEMRGHTSYLTFATLLPHTIERQLDPGLERERSNEWRRMQAAEKKRKRQGEAADVETV